MRKLLGYGFLLALAGLVYQQLPEIRRYMRIKRM
jgi:hypothetical protein